MGADVTAHSADAVRYFAYGSNLDAEQMIRRCPSAKLVGVAHLAGFRLAFAGSSRTWGGAVATLLPDARASVSGLVWALSQADLHVLDGFEGHPRSYRRRTLAVLTKDAGRLGAEVYVKDAPIEGVPSARYFNVILAAYREYRFDEAALLRAVGGVVPTV